MPSTCDEFWRNTQATTMRRERTFRSARMRRTDVKSIESETSSPIRSLAGYIIDTLGSSFRKPQGSGLMISGDSTPVAQICSPPSRQSSTALNACQAAANWPLAHRASVLVAAARARDNHGDAPKPECIWWRAGPLFVHAADLYPILEDGVVFQVCVDRRSLEVGRAKGEHAALYR